MKPIDPEEYSYQSAEQLALRAKQGDKAARDVLYLRLGSTIAETILPPKRLLSRHMRGRGPIEPRDLDQQAFVIFCELLDDWQPALLPFLAYMPEMMRWRAYNYVRSLLHLRSKRVRWANAWPEQLETPDITQPSSEPETLVEGSEAWNALLAQLRNDWKRFVTMRFYEGLPTSEIARATHCSHRTVNRTLRAALELLRQNGQEEREAR